MASTDGSSQKLREEELALPMPSLRTPGLQNHFYCFQPLRLWSFLEAAEYSRTGGPGQGSRSCRCRGAAGPVGAGRAGEWGSFGWHRAGVSISLWGGEAPDTPTISMILRLEVLPLDRPA